MSLRKCPVVDSGELAALRRRELDITPERARSLGLSALAAIRDGRYVADDGQLVDWKADVEKAAASKVSLRPDAPLPATPRARFPETQTLSSPTKRRSAPPGACTMPASGPSPSTSPTASCRAEAS